MEKQYRSSVRTDASYANLPEVGIFSIDEATAREIVKLACVVKDNGLHKVEKFDYSVYYLEYDPEENPVEAEDAGEDNNVPTEADCLVVSGTEFWFSAYLKHTDVDIFTERYSIGELVTYFSLQVEPAAKPTPASFVSNVAQLNIWDHDKNDGTTYEECEKPDDGYLDSHTCLMNLIEFARDIEKTE